MDGRLSLVTAPALEPISAEEARDHLRVDGIDDPALIDRLIVAAREHVEAFTRRALISQTWDWVRDAFPCDGQELPLSNLRSVTSITYLDSTGASTTWSSSNYRVTAPAGPQASPGRISLGFGVYWPPIYPVSDAVTIRFVAGYGTAATDVPAAIRQAMLLLVSELYERRSEATLGATVTPNVLAASRLLGPYRVLRW